LQLDEGTIILPPMLTLGLSNMRDAAAAIVADGRVIAAAEEERFVRVKHATALPVSAIRYCLKAAGVQLRDLDAAAVPWKYWQVGRRGMTRRQAFILVSFADGLDHKRLRVPTAE